jgi:N-methylhydantoinase A
MKLRIGIDVGGTFTDVTAFDEDLGDVTVIRKYLSNRAEPMLVMDTIMKDLQTEFGKDAVSLILHGSTAALNTLLEDNGVRVGLLTTAGFRDVYEMGRQWRGGDVFNLYAPAPKTLLSRDRIHEVRERLAFDGTVIEPLQRDDVVAAVEKLQAQQVEAIAVALLFAYANAGHEQEIARIIEEVAPGMYVSLSSEVNPEWREYERTASTVANAYIGPPAARYLKDLETLSLGYFPGARVLMMKSDGGAASSRMLSRTPIQTVMSGPVAGTIGSRYLGSAKGVANLITFDVGGTSTDMAVVPGQLLHKSEVSVGRHPIRTHAVDIDTVGAGGGSLASIQLGGVLKVGPESAGSNPGPACYMRGGTHPTLTDALVVLGHLNQHALLEGKMAISRDASYQAVEEHVARPLGMSVREAAWGILRVLTTNVVIAMRTISVERGYDPREFALVPFGGMGPTTAARIAAELGINRILIPRDPGTFSAYGMLVSDVQQERSLTRITRMESTSCDELNAFYRDMEAIVLNDLVNENIPREHLTTVRHAGMRYAGQSYEVDVTVPALNGPQDLETLQQRFHEAHHRRYGHMAQQQLVEIVNFQVTGVGQIPKPAMKTFEIAQNVTPAPFETRDAWFGPQASVPTPVYRRNDLYPGTRLIGPLIVEERTSTTVVYPGQHVEVDTFCNMLVTEIGA